MQNAALLEISTLQWKLLRKLVKMIKDVMVYYRNSVKLMGITIFASTMVQLNTVTVFLRASMKSKYEGYIEN